MTDQEKIEVPFGAERVAKTAHGGVVKANLEDTLTLLDRIKLQIHKLIPNPAKELIARAQANSIWMLTFGLACCAIEMMATGTADYDLDRLGIIPRGSPRQADLIIIAGTLPIQMGDQTATVWEQMPEPKYSIAMGVCATDGGPYTLYGYSVLPGADRKIPVNLYVTGCPPRPEALLNSLVELRHMIERREVHASRVLLDANGKPWRHHYVNGVEVGQPEEVTLKRWGELHPKQVEKIEWGAVTPELGTRPEQVELGNRLKERFQVEFIDNPIPSVKLAASELRPLCRYLYDTEGFSRITTVSATDLHGRIGLSYVIENREKGMALALETSVPTEQPEIDTVSDIWAGANSQERSEYDMLGVVFKGHPALKRILLPDDWVGHPLRHDYAWPTTYHGASMY
ncbi:MAG: NADH-quinone oxidoreductase subunit NuoB [Candidatus Xenobia bacterium]